MAQTSMPMLARLAGVLALLLLPPLVADAQPADKVARIGFLLVNSPAAISMNTARRSSRPSMLWPLASMLSEAYVSTWCRSGPRCVCGITLRQPLSSVLSVKPTQAVTSS